MEPDARKSQMLKSKVSMSKSMLAVKSQMGQSHAKSLVAMGHKSISRMRIRKQSYGFGGGVLGIRPIEGRQSQFGLEFKRPQMMYLNTYQLDPRVRFNPPQVKKVAEAVLDEYFTDHKYNAQESPALTLTISGIILRKVKAFGFNRYRILSVVTLGQKRSQSYNNAIAFLWDHERDSYVNVQREVTTAFIQVTVFGIYLD